MSFRPASRRKYATRSLPRWASTEPNSHRLTTRSTRWPLRRVEAKLPSTPAEKVLRPLLIVVGASAPPHQLGRGNILELARRGTVAQRLKRVIERLHRGPG